MSGPKHLVKMYAMYGEEPDLKIVTEDALIAERTKNTGMCNEYCAEYIDQMTRLGNPTVGKRIWVLIGIYHEYAIDFMRQLGYDGLVQEVYENDISAIIFANSVDEAKALLKTHPVYLADMGRVKNQVPDVENEDVLEYIFGDTGQQLAQLSGNFAEVPPEHYHYFI